MPNISPELQMALAAATSFAVAYLSIPSIVRVARLKHLFDEPGERAAHSSKVPTLGGMAIFAGLAISLSLWSDMAAMPQMKFLLASVVIMFFIGLKDDILVIAPLTKMAGQIVAALILVVLADWRITSLHGFLGVTAIPYWASVCLSVFVYLVITNGFNLIDGIDGLASGTALLVCAIFGTWFHLAGLPELATLAVAMAGALLAFFRFNVFSKERKIFMGDTGSLILGIVISAMTISFVEANTRYAPYFVHAAPAVAFGVLILPLFDTLRVMFVRFMLGKGLFQPDKNHIHHSLLALGMSHIKATVVLLSFNMGFAALAFSLSDLEILRMVLLLLLLAMVLSHVPVLLLERRCRAQAAQRRSAPGPAEDALEGGRAARG